MKGVEIPGKSEPEHFHLARLKKGGEMFEVTIDPDLALRFRDGEAIPIRQILQADAIFRDAKKGLHASEHHLKALFNTDDVEQIAEIILKEGDIQLTQEYREKLRAQKRNRIISIIHQNGIDPRTNAPLPNERIENAMREARVKIEEHRTAEDQMKRIIRDLQPHLPIRIAVKELELNLKSQYAAKSLGYMKKLGTILKQTWNNDGSLTCLVQLPAGMFNEFMDKMNSFTHGDVNIKTIEK